MTRSILERVREMTRHALEREAEKLLGLAAVKARISDAAGDGFTHITVAPEKAVDVSQTVAAKATADALRAEGFGVEWEKRQHPDGCTSQALVVRWTL